VTSAESSTETEAESPHVRRFVLTQPICGPYDTWRLETRRGYLTKGSLPSS
jgi:hypothetical protein